MKPDDLKSPDTQRLDWLKTCDWNSFSYAWWENIHSQKSRPLRDFIDSRMECDRKPELPRPPQRRHKIVTAHDADTLSRNLDAYLDNNPEFLGPPFRTPVGNEQWWAQAILWTPKEGE